MPLPWRNRLFPLILFFLLSGLVYSRTYLQQPQSQTVSDASLSPPAIATPRNSSSILVVSGLFPLSKSKHTIREYEYWLSKFLGQITTDIYFYTPVDMVPLVRKCRGNLPITIDTTFASPFDIPPLRDFKEEYGAQHALDREKDIHSAELYAVWNAKPYFLDEAVRASARRGMVYEYAFWNDAGSFRITHGFTDWPSMTRVQEIWQDGTVLTGQQKDDLFFFPVCRVPHPSLRNWEENTGPVDNYFSEASFFGGPPHSVSWWRDVYYAYHDHYLRQGMFVGKDQNLIHALFLLFPSRIIAVWLDDPEAPAHKELLPPKNPAEGLMGTCGENWFYYQFFLAKWADRVSMNVIWDNAARWSWGGWRPRHECRLTRVVWVKDLLHRQFGNDWNPPASSIPLLGP
ncbi:hypothetical protein C8R46DRAFT_1078825 [Mycena filopes]|nr:hypothetical protein C8R46DRAFT_1078825 [Mycena filopes]